MIVVANKGEFYDIALQPTVAEGVLEAIVRWMSDLWLDAASTFTWTKEVTDCLVLDTFLVCDEPGHWHRMQRRHSQSGQGSRAFDFYSISAGLHDGPSSDEEIKALTSHEIEGMIDSLQHYLGFCSELEETRLGSRFQGAPGVPSP